jgi:hypothetical protein
MREYTSRRSNLRRMFKMHQALPLMLLWILAITVHTGKTSSSSKHSFSSNATQVTLPTNSDA